MVAKMEIKAGGAGEISRREEVSKTSGNNQTESRRKWGGNGLISFSYDCDETL